MKALILEGIATSGKSTVMKMVTDMLEPQYRVKAVPELETLMRIVDNTDQSVSIEYLTRLIDRECSGDYDVVLFDRLYLSHMFRTHSEVADYSAIEDKLRAFDTETFFLEVDEDLVASRVAKAAEHRDLTWKEYIYTKGQTIEEVAAYYIGQQRNQLVMLRQSTLPYKVCNTSSHEYDKIAGAIVSRLNPGAPA